MTIVSLDDARQQVGMDDDQLGQDAYLEILIAAALRSVENYIDRPFADDDPDASVIRAASLLLVGHWYANREAVAVGPQKSEMPLTVTWLLMPLKQWGC